jgi:hypothetical protein
VAAEARTHAAVRRAFMVSAGVLAMVTAAAMILVFIVLVADLVQHLLGITVAPAVGHVRTSFWWIVTNRDLPP